MDNQTYVETLNFLSKQYSHRLEYCEKTNKSFIYKLSPGHLMELIDECDYCENLVNTKFREVGKPSAKMWLIKRDLIKKIGAYKKILETGFIPSELDSEEKIQT